MTSIFFLKILLKSWWPLELRFSQDAYLYLGLDPDAVEKDFKFESQFFK